MESEKTKQDQDMTISAVSSSPYAAMQGSDGFAKAKQLFQNLGKALDAGNLTDAKKAVAQLQANAPAQAKNDNNPMSAKIEALSKAVESGDLESAKDAYADIKETMSQRPTGGGGRAGGAGNPPPGGGAPPSGAGKSSETSGISDSSKVYDPEDTNKDGTVSWKEEQDYKLKHPEKADGTSTASKLDVWA